MLIKGILSVFVFSISVFIYFSLQHPVIYTTSLGRISSNYCNNKGEIVQVKKPYEKIEYSNMYRWDAQLYKTIGDDGYARENVQINERFAFYPLFPFLWKISGIDSPLIFILNYFLFVIALILLSEAVKEKNTPDNLFTFLLAILLPPVVICYLPYAESLFILSLVIAICGLVSRKYWLFFAGALAFSMTRPAVVIFIFALVLTDLRYFLIHRKFYFFLREVILKILPFIAGFILVTLIQYGYSSSWTAYFEALTFWPSESGLFNKITDWSIEGFGMTVFAIFFLATPCLIYSVVWGSKVFRKDQENIKVISLFSGDRMWIKQYLFDVSVLFTVGNLAYTFLTSGNVLNGFYRYTMSVPTFYIILFLLPERIGTKTLLQKSVAVILCLAAAIIFLAKVAYGDDRFRFQYMGMYLSIIIFLFIVFEHYMSFPVKVVLLILLLLSCLTWHSYLFNMYISDAWLFT